MSAHRVSNSVDSIRPDIEGVVYLAEFAGISNQFICAPVYETVRDRCLIAFVNLKESDSSWPGSDGALQCVSGAYIWNCNAVSEDLLRLFSAQLTFCVAHLRIEIVVHVWKWGIRTAGGILESLTSREVVTASGNGDRKSKLHCGKERHDTSKELRHRQCTRVEAPRFSSAIGSGGFKSRCRSAYISRDPKVLTHRPTEELPGQLMKQDQPDGSSHVKACFQESPGVRAQHGNARTFRAEINLIPIDCAKVC